MLSDSGHLNRRNFIAVGTCALLAGCSGGSPSEDESGDSSSQGNGGGSVDDDSEGSDQRKEANEGNTLREGATHQWTYETAGPIVASPIEDNGLLYFGDGGEGNLYSYNIKKQSLQWFFETGSAVRTSPTATDDRIYIVRNGGIHSLSKSGEEIWKYEKEVNDEKAVIIDGQCLIGGRKLTSLDTQNGESLWEYEPEGGISSPAVVNSTLIVNAWPRLIALSVDDGSKIWERSYEIGGVGVPIASSEAIISGYGTIRSPGGVRAVDYNGDSVWDYKIGGGPKDETGGVVSPPSLSEGAVFAGSANGEVHSIDINNGTKNWVTSLDSPIYTTPAIHDEIVFIGDEQYNLTAIDQSDGEILWSGRVFENQMLPKGGLTSPILNNGVIIFGSASRAVVAYS